MNYFLDTEFYERPNQIDLISIGIVSEDGREYYAESKEAPYIEIQQDPWLYENVLLNLNGYKKYNDTACCMIQGKFIHEIKDEILKFIGNDNPTFYSYYGAYDWVVFCWIFGRMIDLPYNYPMLCIDLQQIYLDKLSQAIIIEKPEDNEKEHNSLADARWNKKLWEALGKP